MQKGKVRHGDSIGNSGVIKPGDLQWMTAGSGIIHEEMPQFSPNGLRGFQLWVNLSRAEKMRDPAYRGFAAKEVTSVSVGGGEAKILAGELGGVRGPVAGVSRDPAYFDLRLGPGGKIEIPAPEGETAFAYVYDGSLFCPCEPLVYAGHMRPEGASKLEEPRPSTDWEPAFSSAPATRLASMWDRPEQASSSLAGSRSTSRSPGAAPS